MSKYAYDLYLCLCPVFRPERGRPSFLHPESGKDGLFKSQPTSLQQTKGSLSLILFFCNVPHPSETMPRIEPYTSMQIVYEVRRQKIPQTLVLPRHRPLLDQ